MTEVEKTIPRKLAAVLAAFGAKLTGEQLVECLRIADNARGGTSLTHQQRYVALDILNDEDLAQWYGFERSEGLEALRTLRNKCEAMQRVLIDADKDWRSNGLRGELSAIASAATDAVKQYDNYMGTLRALIAEIDTVAGK